MSKLSEHPKTNPTGTRKRSHEDQDNNPTTMEEKRRITDGEPILNSEQSIIWQKLCTVYQRLLLAKAVERKMNDIQIGYSEDGSTQLLKSLQDEILILNLVKVQLEEAMSQFFLKEIALNEIDLFQEKISFENKTSATTFPTTHAITPLVSPVVSNQNPSLDGKAEKKP